MSTNTPGTGTTNGSQREEFDAHESTAIVETSSTAMAEQAKAAVQSRFIVAMKRPRDWDSVRVALLKDCKRPGFAQVSRYSKPIGGSRVEGPSIRFAEAAIRAMTNLLPETTTIYDDDAKRIVRVALTDLESNVSYSKDVTIAKTVERSSLKQGQTAIRTRVNSFGKPVHIVAATDEDLLNKENALVSKALRGHALRLLPGDILEECMAQVVDTLENEAARDPDAERKRLADAFASLNVSPAALKDYLGHELATVTAKEIVELRAIYSAIKDGETSWATVMESKGGGAHGEEKPAAGDAGAPPKTTQDLVDRAAKAKKAKDAPQSTEKCEACSEVGKHKTGCPNGPDVP